jgi:hypothetical protein
MTEMMGTMHMPDDPMEAGLQAPGTPDFEEEVVIKKKERLRLTENDLLGERGIDRIYADFPKKHKSHGKGHEVRFRARRLSFRTTYLHVF